MNASLAVAEATARELDAAAGGYRPAAARAEALFFVLSDLAALDPMYRFSLDEYSRLFASSLRAAPKAEALGERIKAVNDHHTYAVYRWGRRAPRAHAGLPLDVHGLAALRLCVRRCFMHRPALGPNLAH